MKSLRSFSKVLLITAALLSASHAFAAGVGPYITGTYGIMKWNYEPDSLSAEQIPYESDIRKIGLGLLFDTNVSKDRLFNYRLNLGLDYISINNNKRSKTETYYQAYNIPAELNDRNCIGFHANNSFGFGLYRTESYRIWVGPQVGFGFYYDDKDKSNITKSPFWNYFFMAGIASGINMHIAESYSLAIDCGFRYTLNVGGNDDEFPAFINGKGYEAFITMSAILRFNDTFSAGQQLQ
jgi:hypothetical protein